MNDVMAKAGRFISLGCALVGLSVLPASGQDDTRMAAEMANAGQFAMRGQKPDMDLADFNLLHQQIGAIADQAPGKVEAFVLTIGLDSDAVFSKEAIEAGRVLARRYHAENHMITLAVGAPDPKTVADGNPRNLSIALAALAEKMDKSEDVLVIYTTSHGHPVTGIAYRDGQVGGGNIGPSRLTAMINSLGIERRLVIISACYSGVFVPRISSPKSVIVTAASARTSSFGCAASNDWTFFGDAFINQEMRKPQDLRAAFDGAKTLISGWESAMHVVPSEPQIRIGRDAVWLSSLDADVPTEAGTPVGRPSYRPN